MDQEYTFGAFLRGEYAINFHGWKNPRIGRLSRLLQKCKEAGVLVNHIEHCPANARPGVFCAPDDKALYGAYYTARKRIFASKLSWLDK